MTLCDEERIGTVIEFAEAELDLAAVATQALAMNWAGSGVRAALVPGLRPPHLRFPAGEQG